MVSEGLKEPQVNASDSESLRGAEESMKVLMRTPVVRSGALLPDACPAGHLGTIPVGGVVVSEAIHPGMHSSDVCCSVYCTVLDSCGDPKEILDIAEKVTHFGRGPRRIFSMPQPLKEGFRSNPLLEDLVEDADAFLGTQGDGNHFLFVGRLKSTGQICVVTHHGSRALGDKLYRRGMEIAERYRKKLSPETLKINAWIPPFENDGLNYWDALHIIKNWTEYNHEVIHEKIAQQAHLGVVDHFWNPHNFIFSENVGEGAVQFYHAKGATPAFGVWSRQRTLIPLNMASPILVVVGKNQRNALGYSPHGAGREMSRTAFLRTNPSVDEIKHIDFRPFGGEIDLSELPSAYKSPEKVRKEIVDFDLAEIVDEIIPYGSIMKGK